MKIAAAGIYGEGKPKSIAHSIGAMRKSMGTTGKKMSPGFKAGLKATIREAMPGPKRKLPG
jgi:hypothetical protein